MPSPARPFVPVSVQSAGEVRRLRARLTAEADALLTAAGRLPAAWVAAAAMKGSTGAARAWARILAAMPCPPTVFDRNRRAAVWRLLRPRDAVFVRDSGSAAGAGPGVVVGALVVGLARGRPVVDEAPWGLSFSTHALCRLLDRSAAAVDPVAVMLAAHDALLGASRECAKTILAERYWAVPGGLGAFLTTLRGMRYRDDDAVVVANGGTWVSDDMLHPNQLAQVAALRFRQVGGALQDGLLLPAPLRAAVRPVADELGEVGRFGV